MNIKYVLKNIEYIPNSKLDSLLPFSKEIAELLKYKRKDLD